MALESNPDPCSRTPAPVLPTWDPPACGREQSLCLQQPQHSKGKRQGTCLSFLTHVWCPAAEQKNLAGTEHVCPNIEPLAYVHGELSQRLPVQISIKIFLGRCVTGMCTKQINWEWIQLQLLQLANMYLRFIQALVIEDIIYSSFPCCHMSQSSHNTITTCAKIFELQNYFAKTMCKKYSCKRPAKIDVSYLPFQYYFYTGTCNLSGKKELNYF